MSCVQLHLAGIVSDLPIHQSNEKEIHELVDATKTLLIMMLRKFNQSIPRVITIARSTEDEYTPANQVELIQDSVIMAIKQVYHDNGNACVMVNYDYLCKSRKCSNKWVYETPADVCDCTYI